jgi:hypothetical protein
MLDIVSNACSYWLELIFNVGHNEEISTLALQHDFQVFLSGYLEHNFRLVLLVCFNLIQDFLLIFLFVLT